MTFAECIYRPIDHLSKLKLAVEEILKKTPKQPAGEEVLYGS